MTTKASKKEFVLHITQAENVPANNDDRLADAVARSLICQAAAKCGNVQAADYFGRPLGIRPGSSQQSEANNKGDTLL